MKRLTLLSGGEKSMTAVAFLFASSWPGRARSTSSTRSRRRWTTSTSTRFLTLLRRYADRAQFIVVTHQKRTMEAADTLYGVSMGGDGVSKVVSRRLAARDAPTPSAARPSSRQPGCGQLSRGTSIAAQLVVMLRAGAARGEAHAAGRRTARRGRVGRRRSARRRTARARLRRPRRPPAKLLARRPRRPPVAEGAALRAKRAGDRGRAGVELRRRALPALSTKARPRHARCAADRRRHPRAASTPTRRAHAAADARTDARRLRVTTASAHAGSCAAGAAAAQPAPADATARRPCATVDLRRAASPRPALHAGGAAGSSGLLAERGGHAVAAPWGRSPRAPQAGAAARHAAPATSPATSRRLARRRPPRARPQPTSRRRSAPCMSARAPTGTVMPATPSDFAKAPRPDTSLRRALASAVPPAARLEGTAGAVELRFERRGALATSATPQPHAGAAPARRHRAAATQSPRSPERSAAAATSTSIRLASSDLTPTAEPLTASRCSSASTTALGPPGARSRVAGAPATSMRPVEREPRAAIARARR